MEAHFYESVIAASISLLLYPVWTYNMSATGSPEWRLYNGLQTFEGIVQVNISGNWTNICTTNLSESSALVFCEQSADRLHVYKENVFGTKEITEAISIDDLEELNRRQSSDYVQCEHVLTICCYDLATYATTVSCSGNWTFVNSRDIHRNYKRPSLHTVYIIDLSNSENQTIEKFWTASAFKEVLKPTNGSVPDDDVVKSCFNDCLDKQRYFNQLTVKNETCDFQLTADSENSRTFKLTDNRSDTGIIMCVSAEFHAARWTLKAENCNKTYRDHTFYNTKYQPKPHISPTTRLISALTVSSTLQTLINENENKGSPEWRLYNGLQKFEGIFQVNIDGNWTNICTTNFSKSFAREFCKKDKDYVVYTENVFGSDEITEAISIVDFQEENRLQNSDLLKYKCKPVAICCDYLATSLVSCSGNWSFVNSRNIHRNFKRPSLQTVYTLDFSNSGNKNIEKFWTASAFKEISSTTNRSTLDDNVVRSCFNDCLYKHQYFPQLTVKNETCNLNLSADSENSRTFNLTDNITDTGVILCVSAEFHAAQWTLKAENCNKTSRDHTFFDSRYKKTTTVPTRSWHSWQTSSSITSALNSTTVRSTTNDKEDRENALPEWSLIFIVIVSGILVTVVIVVSCVVYRIRKLKVCQDETKHNYVPNKTYSHEMTLHRSNSVDEYANISDCDIDMIDLSSGSHRPPLPNRETESASGGTRHDGDVMTLDQYSTPLDTLGNSLQDEYSFTYDDPIRINKISCDEQTYRAAKKNLKRTNTSDSNEIVNETIKSNTEPQSHCPSIKEGQQCVKVNIETGISTGNEVGSKLMDCAKSKRVSEYEIAVLPSDNGTLSIVNDSGDDNFNSDNSEYELTTIANYEDSTTKHSIFTDHICLDCLTSEQLKAFGVSIVPDDNCYSRCKDLAKRFSAPCTVSQNSGEGITESNHTKCETVEQSVCSGESETCTDIDSGQRCSVCHSVYDRIGKYNRNNWIKYTDNVYEKFGHFHTRRHAVGKRVNST